MIISQLSDVLCTILIMSLSGSVLILLLFALKPLIRHRLSKSVQYALWLITLVALLVPVSKLIVIPEAPSNMILAPIQAVVQHNNIAGEENVNELTNTNTELQTDPTDKLAVKPAESPALTITAVLTLTYVLIVLVVLSYNIFSYIRFTKKVRRHRIRARMEELYEHVGLCGDALAPRLYRSALATTPMLIGIFKPEIILPDREYTNAQIQSVLRHELTHMRRRDIIFKWLSVFACALHWFNPLVWLARREIDRICELSCDEAVIRNLDIRGKQSYGETLIFVAADTKASRTVLSTTMCEEKEVLKERLNVIMKYQKRTWITLIISTIIMTAAVCAVFVFGAGAAPSSATAYTADAVDPASIQSPLPSATTGTTSEQVSLQSELPSATSEVITQPVPMQSYFPSSTPSLDPEYLNELRQNAVEVNTEIEFTDVLNTAYVILLKKDMTLSGDVFLTNLNALVIDEGVTLTVTSLNFQVDCPIINLGEIVVDGRGRMLFRNEPDYASIGKISTKGRDAQICIDTGVIGADEIETFLSEDSLFNWIYVVAYPNDGKLPDILVDHDIVIPAGKTLWLNADSVLHVPKGVTLTNNGVIHYSGNKPVIEGTIDGTGQVVHG